MYNWDESLSVNIQSIDNQHKEIISVLNTLLEAMKKGQATDIVNKIIFELEKYAMVHFQKEEYFFKKFNYAGAEEHILEHRKFSNKIAQLKADIKSGKTSLTIDLLNYLKTWIEHHIKEVDKQYSACFKENGLK